MNDRNSSGPFGLSFEDLNDEYSSRPPLIAEWLWCIEYIAKFCKDLRYIHEMMNMGYQYSNDYGRRINEVLSLRILEFMFDPSKNEDNGVDVASTSEAKVEFDLSLSSADVLKAILKEIPVSELRAGMPELSKFNGLQFIAHKNMCLPQCALEKLSDLGLMENQTTAAHSTETNDPVFRDDTSPHMNTCEEEPIDEQQVQNINEKDAVIGMDDDEQVHIGVEQNVNDKDKVMENQTTAAHSMETNDPDFRDGMSAHMDTREEEQIDEQQMQNINEKDEVIAMDDNEQVHIGVEQNVNNKDRVIAIEDEAEPMHTNEKDKVLVIEGDTEIDQDITGEPIDKHQVQNINEKDEVIAMDDEQVHIGLEQNVNDMDKVIAIDDEAEQTRNNEKDEVHLINGDTEIDQDITGEPINKSNSTDDTFSPSSRKCLEDAHVTYTKEGTWLISGNDDDSDMVPLSSQTRSENVCWKCEKEGTLLICSRSECAAKVHKECMNCPVNVDEKGNFLCPLCWYDRVAMEYDESQKLISFVKRRLVKSFSVLPTRS